MRRIGLICVLLGCGHGCGHGRPDAPAPAPTVAAVAPRAASADRATSLGDEKPIASAAKATVTADGFLRQYCFACHAGGKKKGGVSFETPPSEEIWQKVLARVEGQEMPPDDEPQPTDDERARLVGWVEDRVFRCAEPRTVEPRMTVRRLNRHEYENSVRDLLGVNVALAAELPSDNSGHGFDNMAEALTTSPLLVERYLRAADRALAAAIYDPDLARARRRRFAADELALGGHARPEGRGGWVLLSSLDEDELVSDVAAAYDARFVVRVRAHRRDEPRKKPVGPVGAAKPATAGAPPAASSTSAAPASEPRPAVLSIMVDDTVAASVEVMAPRESPALYEAEVSVPPGRHRLRLVMRRDKKNLSSVEAALPRTGKPQPAGVRLQSVEVTGPVGAPAGPTQAHRNIFFREPATRADRAAAREILARFATRAFRRSATPDEVERLVELAARGWQKGARFEEGVRLALRAVLVSPQFLFRREREPEADTPPGTTDYALAGRLSYFLWSTLPDEALRADAERGTLRANLRHHVDRMIADPRIQAFVDGFAGQWLQFRMVEDAQPAPQRYKDWGESLRHAIHRETELLFEHVLRENRPALELIDARYTFVNERLARHYGIPGISGEGFQRVSLESTPRRGILTHASILTITSNPTRTSPVKRGKWVLETLLAAPPPPPPPDVPPLPEERGEGRKPLRQRLEQHRADPTCATCHARMDPLGFGLEAFDGIGAHRTEDGGQPVDTRGTLTTGEGFDGALQLVDVLTKTKKDLFMRAVASRLLTYALGRGLEAQERCAVVEAVRRAGEDGHRLAAFVRAVAESAPFLDTR